MAVFTVIQLVLLAIYLLYLIWYAVMFFRGNQNGFRFQPGDHPILVWILFLGGVALGVLALVG